MLSRVKVWHRNFIYSNVIYGMNYHVVVYDEVYHVVIVGENNTCIIDTHKCVYQTIYVFIMP